MRPFRPWALLRDAGRVGLRGVGEVPRARTASAVQLGSRERRARQRLLPPRLLHAREVRCERGWCSRARGGGVGGRGKYSGVFPSCRTYED